MTCFLSGHMYLIIVKGMQTGKNMILPSASGATT